MKKNIFCITLLVISLAAFIIFTKHKEITTDTTPPVITCDFEEIRASVEEINDEFLLKGVTAYDKECGDVTDSLMIQSISKFIQKNVVVVTYAAVDSGNNVGRLERNLILTDYEEPTFTLTKPLIYPAGTNVRFLGNIRANSIVDGDLSARIRYGLEKPVDNNAPSTSYPITFRVTDSLGKTSYLETEILIVNNLYSTAEINLSKYIVYIPQNSKFNQNTAKEFITGVSTEYNPSTDLTIDCKVDTSTPGVYNVDYTLNSINANGKSRLVVVVEPN